MPDGYGTMEHARVLGGKPIMLKILPIISYLPHTVAEL